MLCREFGPHAVEVVQGDITTQRVDAIVNAANSTLLGGGGVDGAIHRAGGPSILEQCRALPGGSVRCPPGEVRTTGAGALPCRHVIHGVGPVYARHPRAEAERLLRGVHRAALDEVRRLGLGSVAFPAISCGVYGYPLHEAAPAALGEVVDALESCSTPTTVRFVLFSEPAYRAFAAALESRRGS
jgi:O-acetyl-ADP-ribose deacetylase (regulator of RNase III)